MKLKNDALFKDILKDLRLGALTVPPRRVYGGFLHKMYCLETTAGKFALKLLNPEIMKRPDVFENYRRAEELERVLGQRSIPILPAMEFGGRKMQCSGERYYYVFPWSEGKALGWEEINEEHCRMAGDILAKIHKTGQKDTPFVIPEIGVDWDAYISAAKTAHSAITEELESCRDALYAGQEAYNQALARIPALTCISNGDMDSKNVLWLDGNPIIIDLECLGYGNPFWDMFRLALSWAGDVRCDVDVKLFVAFIRSYRQTYGDFSVDWDVLYGSGFGWLEWLEYNVKRALLMECEDEEEQRMGITEVRETLRRILYYHSVKDKLLESLALI